MSDIHIMKQIQNLQKLRYLFNHIDLFLQEFLNGVFIIKKNFENLNFLRIFLFFLSKSDFYGISSVQGNFTFKFKLSFSENIISLIFFFLIMQNMDN